MLLVSASWIADYCSGMWMAPHVAALGDTYSYKHCGPSGWESPRVDADINYLSPGTPNRRVEFTKDSCFRDTNSLLIIRTNCFEYPSEKSTLQKSSSTTAANALRMKNFGYCKHLSV